MVDPSRSKNVPDNRETIKRLMGRTPGFFKSKFLSTLGNDILTGISNRLDLSLNINNTSAVPTEEDEENAYHSDFDDDDDDSIDENVIDFDLRNIKERRAREEIISGRYRQLNFLKTTADEYNIVDVQRDSAASTMSPNSINNDVNSNATSPLREIQPDHEAFATYTFEVTTMSSRRESLQVEMPKLGSGDSANVSTATSENDLNNSSVASSETNLWVSSESETSVEIGGASASVNSQPEEALLEFMRTFVKMLFTDSSSITLNIKSEFGINSRSTLGRMWFARLVSAQRNRSKHVNEPTFYSLIQYIAIVLFECCDSEDFPPANILMNMCFIFYYEIEVPGCEPYREYLYTYLREQPIWQSLRFWCAAFDDSLQSRRLHRSDPAPVGNTPTRLTKLTGTTHQSSPTKHYHLMALSSTTGVDQSDDAIVLTSDAEETEERHFCFGQLGTLTCNMHAFGLSRQFCIEFLYKQHIVANLSKDQEKMLRDNVNRMYKETAKWRS